ncbi:MAG: TetR/AcrR family transcriptional regulator [Acidimicrobiales bacterium]|jgi:AcrR family transcriptional regulator|nr:TetR/AcrR family transcriptional regulator [Acidimicrobiales bacterium]HBL08199.1 TetR family transcriptional regulator [Acidimicrobiaceae bacterium]HIM85987.1 TetR/AcrR family transcriptional regulator [Acidimicrobiia bacterium]
MADTATASVRLPARQRRQQLLDVALGVFSRLGYHETSMNALASEAGVTKPVLYQHFASKHDLFRELLAQTGDRLLTAISEQAHSLDTPRQRVEAGFRAFFDFFDEHPDAFGVLYGSSLGSDPSFREEARRVQDNFAEYVSRLIKVTDHDDAVAMASGINGLSEGMIRHWMHHGRSRPAAEMAALTARLAWGGLERLA